LAWPVFRPGSTENGMSELSKDLQDLISGRQHNRILSLSFPHNDGPDCLLLVDTLEAVESLSRPFDFTVGLLSDNANLESDK
jgi:type VI secretion system secreted protein VgrG